MFHATARRTSRHARSHVQTHPPTRVQPTDVRRAIAHTPDRTRRCAAWAAAGGGPPRCRPTACASATLARLWPRARTRRGPPAGGSAAARHARARRAPRARPRAARRATVILRDGETHQILPSATRCVVVVSSRPHLAQRRVDLARGSVVGVGALVARRENAARRSAEHNGDAQHAAAALRRKPLRRRRRDRREAVRGALPLVRRAARRARATRDERTPEARGTNGTHPPPPPQNEEETKPPT